MSACYGSIPIIKRISRGIVLNETTISPSEPVFLIGNPEWDLGSSGLFCLGLAHVTVVVCGKKRAYVFDSNSLSIYENLFNHSYIIFSTMIRITKTPIVK